MKTQKRLLASIFVLGLTGPVIAQEVKPIHELSVNPFTGTHEEACRLHVEAHGLFSQHECLKAIVLSDDPESCQPRAVLQEGTVWWMLFTGRETGEHQIGIYRISFGAQVAVDDPMRIANDCLGVAEGKDMVKPLACGNYAVPYQPLVKKTSPPAVPRTADPKPKMSSIPSSSDLVASEQGVTVFPAAPIQIYCQTCCQ